MGNTRNTGYLQNIVQYDVNNNIILPSLTGTGSRMVISSSTGLLSTQAIPTLTSLGGVPTSRTISINGVTFDLTANRSWSALPVGGVAGQLLAKIDGTDYNTQWINEAPAASYTSQVKHIVKSSQAITKGQAVYVSSADGTNMIVSKASNASEQTSSKTMGLLESTVAINGTANVITEGLLAGLDTTGANAAGDPVWLGTDGNLIYGLVSKPVAPAHLVFIGVVTRRNANNGEIFVKVQNGFELDELHDLSVKNASDGDMIKYVASTGLWTKIAATTTNITEGTNLYYTDARVGTYLTTNSYATQSFVSTQINNLIAGAPNLLNTLDELAAALGDDANFASTVTTSLAGKQASLSGTGFVKISGTTISYDNSTYLTTSSAASTYLPLTGGTVTGVLSVNSALRIKSGSPNGILLETYSTNELRIRVTPVSTTFDMNLVFPSSSRTYTYPNATGTIALTSDIPTVAGVYLPLAGGTLTGPLVGTSATFNHNDAPTVRVQRNGGTDSNTVIEFTNASRSFYIGSNGTVLGLGGTTGSVGSQPLQISSTGAATFSNTLQVSGGNITSFSSIGAAGFGNGINIYTQAGTYTSGHGGILQFQNEDVITGGIRAIRDGGSWGGSLLFYTHNTSAGNTFNTTFVEGMRLTSSGNLSIGNNNDTYKLDVSGTGIFRGSGTVTGTVFIQAGHLWSLNADQSGGGSPAFAGSGFYIKNENTSTIALGFNTAGAATFLSNVTINGDSTTSGVANFNNEVRAGAYALSSLNYIDGTGVPLSTRRFRASQSRTNNDNGAVGLDLTNLQSTNGVYSPIISFSSTTSGGVYNCTYAAIWGVKTADEGSWASGDLIFGTANPYGVTQRLRITAAGAANFSGAISTTSGLNSSKNIVAGEATPLHLSYSSSDGNGPAVRFGGAQGFWDIQPSSSNQRLSFEWSDSVNALSLFSDGRVGINDTNPSRELAVNYGTSVNDGLIVYGSQRQNTVFRSTGEHCFLYIDSFHNNIFLPRLHFQRSSTTFGVVGLERASNSDGIGAYAESEMVVGTSTTVPFSIQTNSQRRIRVASGGGVEVFNTLSVSGNLTARNFSRNIKSWAPPGSTGSGASTTYNWADELAALAGNFDSAGYYKGFIRSGNGAHYNGYHFDILVGSQGYGGNSQQYKVQNITPAHSPWVGGCGFSPFGTVDNTNFTHVNNPCGEHLELFITKLGG